jgi:glycosyltransferase involved in cell wall biosynthesis
MVMPFQLYKYIQPTHYFNLKRKDSTYIYPLVNEDQNSRLDIIDSCIWNSEQAKQYYQSWSLIRYGETESKHNYRQFKTLPLLDEYQFLRKTVSRAWVYYVLMLRIVKLNNPFREIEAFIKSRNSMREKNRQSALGRELWEQLDISGLKIKPLITVVIPTLNRYIYLKDVLKDLERQDYKKFEVIVVDQSEPFQANFYKNFALNLNCIRQQEKALWLARNTAIKQAKGQYILLFDDDSRVEPDWITNHLKCLEAFKADISSGISISKIGDKVPEHYTIFKISDQLDTGNAMVKKEVFDTIGLFDRQFERQRMGDGEFGARAFVNNLKNISNPMAKRLHLKVEVGGLRDMGSWDAFRTRNWLAPRPIPSVLYYFRRYYGNSAARMAILKTVPLSIMPYKFKQHKVLKIVGVFVSLLLLPLVGYQVIKSWRLASEKLAEGPQIESLS